MEEQSIQRLIAWGKFQGAALPEGVSFEYSDRKGIRCVCEKSLSSPYLTIPDDLIISGKLIPLEFREADHKRGNTWLKFLLAKMKFGGEECNSDLSEKFRPYLDCLPKIVDCPLVWNPRELSHLAGTNLGSSVRPKLKDILTEWYRFVKENEVTEEAAVSSDCSFYKDYGQLSDESIFRWLVEPLSNGSTLQWSSASAFLWSHLILLSRAFPHYIIDQNVDQASLMLLPIIDLLNHDYHSKVEWGFNEGQFSFKKLDSIEEDAELCNNYGCKGNEELLSGYGFVLEENPFDFVALKIKLPLETITTILKEEPTLKIPTLDDYTNFAFEKQSQNLPNKPEASVFEDGIVYFINKLNASCLDPLLNMFAYLCRGNSEWHSLASKFNGLQNLRNALESKLAAAKSFSSQRDDCSIDSSKYEVNSYRRHCARIYRDGQLSVLKDGLKKLKAMEKTWLTEYKDRLLTVKKITKYDKGFFGEELPAYFESIDRKQDDVVFENNFELLVIWILIKIENNSFIEKHDWVSEQYRNFLIDAKNEDITSDRMDPSIESFRRRMINGTTQTDRTITLKKIVHTFDFVQKNSFTRISSSNPDTIMVRN